MKTITVEDNTWKDLQQLKLKCDKPTLDAVIRGLLDGTIIPSDEVPYDANPDLSASREA